MNPNFNGMNMNNMNNYIMFQQFLNSQANNNMFQQQNMNNMNFNQNMFQQCMNQINMNNQFGNQPNFNFNPNMNIGNFNNAFLQNMFQMFFQWMMSQGMINNMNNNFNFNINNNNGNNNMNNRFNNLNQNNNNNINTSSRDPNFINFIFASGTGLSINLRVQSDKTIEDLLKIYANKAGFSESLLGTDINFLFDAEVMKIHDQTRLDKKFKRDYHTITVIDIKNVLGA